MQENQLRVTVVWLRLACLNLIIFSESNMMRVHGLGVEGR